MRTQITKRQQQILDAIVAIQNEGLSPTHKRIGERVGLGPSGIHGHLSALRWKGVVDWEPSHLGHSGYCPNSPNPHFDQQRGRYAQNSVNVNTIQHELRTGHPQLFIVGSLEFLFQPKLGRTHSANRHIKILSDGGCAPFPISETTQQLVVALGK